MLNDGQCQGECFSCTEEQDDCIDYCSAGCHRSMLGDG